MDGGQCFLLEGMGDIEVKNISLKGLRIAYKLKDVLLVPYLDCDFISVFESTEKSMKVVFEGDGGRINFNKNDKVIVNGVKVNHPYIMNLKPMMRVILWHERLGHKNFTILRKMINKSAIDDLKIDTCHKIIHSVLAVSIENNIA